MGLSFHYSGRIKDQSLIKTMADEVQDICESLGWTFHLFNYPGELIGISLSPDRCEPLFLTFLSNGRLCSPVNLMVKDIYSDDEDLMYTASTKTQFAGPDTHLALMKLLIYIQPKYFVELNVNDEGFYWETRDEKVLLSQFAKYNYALKMVEAALTDLQFIPHESVESLANRLEQLLRNKIDDKDD